MLLKIVYRLWKQKDNASPLFFYIVIVVEVVKKINIFVRVAANGIEKERRTALHSEMRPCNKLKRKKSS